MKPHPCQHCGRPIPANDIRHSCRQCLRDYRRTTQHDRKPPTPIGRDATQPQVPLPLSNPVGGHPDRDEIGLTEAGDFMAFLAKYFGEHGLCLEAAVKAIEDGALTKADGFADKYTYEHPPRHPT